MIECVYKITQHCTMQLAGCTTNRADQRPSSLKTFKSKCRKKTKFLHFDLHHSEHKCMTMLECNGQNKWQVHAETYRPHSIISYLGEAGCLAIQGRETVPWRQVWALRSQVKPLGQQWVWSVQHTACVHFYTKNGWLIGNIYQQNIS